MSQPSQKCLKQLFKAQKGRALFATIPDIIQKMTINKATVNIMMRWSLQKHWDVKQVSRYIFIVELESTKKRDSCSN